MSPVVEDFFGIFLRFCILPNLSLSLKPAGRVTFEMALVRLWSIMAVGHVLVSLVEINVSDVSMFKLTNIFAGQDYTSKQRKTDDFLFYNRSDLGCFHFHVNLVAGLSWKRCLRRKFLPGEILYYSNSVATYNVLLLRAEDVERNPGDKLKCPACQRTIA